jgi:hypothetical protein
VNMAAMAVTIIEIVRNATSVKRFDTVWEKACRNAKIGVPFLKAAQRRITASGAVFQYPVKPNQTPL